MQAILMNSVRVYGMTPFVMEAEVVYQHTAERILISNNQLAVPLEGESAYQGGYPEWADKLIAPGLPWFPGEKKIIDHLVNLIPEISDAGRNDVVYQLLTSQRVKVLPFAYPICFRRANGPKSTGRGLATKNRKMILVLRSFLAHDPFGLLAALYHEGLHVAIDADELTAHRGQLSFCQSASRWLQRRNLEASDAIARDQICQALTGMQRSLERAIQGLQ